MHHFFAQIVLMLIETCYKALFNSMTRSMQEKEGNKRLMEKAMRLQFIVDGMRARNESDEMIQEVCYKRLINLTFKITIIFP